MIVRKSLAYARLLAFCTKQTLTYTKYATGLFCLSWVLYCPLGKRPPCAKGQSKIFDF